MPPKSAPPDKTFRESYNSGRRAVVRQSTVAWYRPVDSSDAAAAADVLPSAYAVADLELIRAQLDCFEAEHQQQSTGQGAPAASHFEPPTGDHPRGRTASKTAARTATGPE